jgi:uncharacterized protein (DUF342 family)
MLKNIVKLEHIIEGKVYQFILDSDSPLNHVKEVLFQFTKYVGQIEEQVKAQQEQAAKQTAEQPPAESKVENLPEQI